MRISGEKREESIFFFEMRRCEVERNFQFSQFAEMRSKEGIFQLSKVRDAEVRNSKMRRADFLEKLVIRGMLEGGPS